MYLTRALGINSIRRSSPISTLYKPIWWTTAAACAVRPLTAAVLHICTGVEETDYSVHWTWMAEKF